MQILLALIVVSIPLMLCVKPCYQASQHSAKVEESVSPDSEFINDDNFNSMDASNKTSDSVHEKDVFNLKENIKACYGAEHGSHSFMELFIH